MPEALPRVYLVRHGETAWRLTGQHTGRTDLPLKDGCPGGESVIQIAARADRVSARLRAAGGDVLVFLSGHHLRVLGAPRLDLDGAVGRFLLLDAAAFSVLRYQSALDEPVIRLWNDCGPLGT